MSLCYTTPIGLAEHVINRFTIHAFSFIFALNLTKPSLA